ncbi:MAG: BatA domain-containing protein [Verrucomicrobiales bacterium]|nr:BatA domain-containing protein [Verrucomicrobiales bacterium]
MSFLYPIYFLGALAMVVPLLLHLRKRVPKHRTVFSSLMFLEESPQRLTRRTKLEKWLLLLLRCLALLLLILMFARPFFPQKNVSGEVLRGKRVLLLLDQSASMRRADLWDQAKAKLLQEVEGLEAEDEVALMVFDEGTSLLLPFAQWRQAPLTERADLLRAALERAELTWEKTVLGEALVAAAGYLTEGGALGGDSLRDFGKMEVVLLSDFQQGSDRGALNQFAWPEGVVLKNVPVEAAMDSNFSIWLAQKEDEGLPESKRSVKKNSARSLRVRVSNSHQGQAEKYTLRWQGESPSAAVVSGNVPPGGTRVVMAPPREHSAVGGILQISGDGFEFDNVNYVAATQARELKILYLADQASQAGAEQAGSALFYLSRALRKTAAIDPQLEVRESGQIGSVNQLKNFDVVVVTGRWDVGLGEELASFAGQTGGVVICVVAADLAAVELEALTGLQGVGLTEVGEDDYAMLTDMDFSHPVLRPFAEAKVRDFSKIHFWKHRVLSMKRVKGLADHVTVMANYDDGSPAWVDVKQGQGHVYLMMSGWQPQESQLALSSKFVPLIYSILNTAGFSAQKSKPIYVGGDLPVMGAKAVKRPGEAELIKLETDQKMFSDTDRPGFYEVVSEGDGQQDAKRTYAVNLSPSESRVDVFDPDSLADFGIVLSAKGSSSDQNLAAEQQALSSYRMGLEETEQSQKLWKWVLLSVLVVLCLESWVAGRVGRGKEIMN